MISTKGEHKKYFESQDPDEEILLVVRRHKIVLSLPFIFATLFIFLIGGLYLIINLINDLGSELARALAGGLIWPSLLFIVLLSFKTWLIKYLDILILTNRRLVVIRQDGFFRRGVSVLDLWTIQDVSSRQHGVFQTFFNFGKIDVQTAGEAPNFVYSGVGDPGGIQDKIMSAKQECTKSRQRHSSSLSI